VLAAYRICLIVGGVFVGLSIVSGHGRDMDGTMDGTIDGTH